ncbi:MAG: NfeD family protein [Verrucomicrobiota bacterium]|jgi:membrane protein implicated in regulation of membrane protease activity
MAFMVYLACLILGLLYTLITAIAGHFGGADHDGGHHVGGSGGHAEAGVDHSDMPGVSFLSPTIIATFVTSFGGFGIIFSQIPATRNPWVSAPLSVLGGILVAAGMLWVLKQLFQRTQSTSESRVGSLVGMTATIITPIPENGVGEIAYVQGGTRYTAPARTENGGAIPNGRPVKITRIIGSQYYVGPLN